MNFYAHTHPDFRDSKDAEKHWEPLFTPFGDSEEDCQRENCEKCRDLSPTHGHLNKVAFWAAKFASEMFTKDSEESKSAHAWGYLTGLWHDLGKFKDDFQRKLEGECISVEHAGAGAVLAKLVFEPHLTSNTHHYPLSAAIAGHHAGLSNFRDQGEGTSTPLLQRLKNNDPLTLDWTEEVRSILSAQSIPSLPLWVRVKRPDNDPSAFSLPFFTRMIFSCLVDADSLVTEALDKGPRSFEYSTISDLSQRLDGKLNEFETLPQDPRKKDINEQRKRILEACQASAIQAHGVFTLNVPTGGGKTLSGMSFALRHAIHCGHRRIIVLAPYTTIIEQTADEYRRCLGEENIIEHHSNLDDFSDAEQQTEATKNKQLAAENWDSPVIVSTLVQFFESLFANKRGRCRKVHNIANSTIILDEAQCLPTSFLDPTLRALNELVDHYNCSLVLSTATQPAFEHRKKFPQGFPKMSPIIPESLTEELHQKLTRKRVSVTWDIDRPKDIASAARLLLDSNTKRKLIVVNTRREASELFEQISGTGDADSLFHLSTNLCAAHRRQKLSEIKTRLSSELPSTVVSTQLIECGVDHSYERVVRALAGFDSLVQSAGRCNRHGEISQGGEFVVYESERKLLGFLANCASITRVVIGDTRPDHLADLSLYDAYFRHLYQSGAGRDTAAVLAAYDERNFEDVARRYKLIEDHKAYTVVIPWGREGEERLKTVRDILRFGQKLSRRHLRSLQPYTVSLARHDFEIVKPFSEPLLEGGFSHFVHPASLDQIYSQDLGLKLHSKTQTYLGCHD